MVVAAAQAKGAEGALLHVLRLICGPFLLGKDVHVPCFCWTQLLPRAHEILSLPTVCHAIMQLREMLLKGPSIVVADEAHEMWVTVLLLHALIGYAPRGIASAHAPTLADGDGGASGRNQASSSSTNCPRRRNPESKFCRAMAQVATQRRVALTGYPLQVGPALYCV